MDDTHRITCALSTLCQIRDAVAAEYRGEPPAVVGEVMKLAVQIYCAQLVAVEIETTHQTVALLTPT